MRCAPYGATNVFPEAWGAPHGPVLATGGPATAGFFPQLPETPQSSRANDNLGKQATPDLTYFQKHGELHMGPCSALPVRPSPPADSLLRFNTDARGLGFITSHNGFGRITSHPAGTQTPDAELSSEIDTRGVR